MYPTQNGLIFVPLTFDIPLLSQLQDVDAVLHKATDEIVDFNPHISTHFSHGISFSKGMQELERWLSELIHLISRGTKCLRLILPFIYGNESGQCLTCFKLQFSNRDQVAVNSR